MSVDGIKFFVRVCDSEKWDGSGTYIPNENEDEWIRGGFTDPDFRCSKIPGGGDDSDWAFGHMAADTRWNRTGGSVAPYPYSYQKGTGIGVVGKRISDNKQCLVIYPKELMHMNDADIKERILTRCGDASKTRCSPIYGAAEVNIAFSIDDSQKIIEIDFDSSDFTVSGDYYVYKSGLKLHKKALDKCLASSRKSIRFRP